MCQNATPQMELLYSRKELTDPDIDKHPARDHRVMSLHLARTLDEIGLNTLTVKRRRHACLCAEQIENVSHRLTTNFCTTYFFGSQTEGTTTRGLDSDVDTLNCMNNVNVIEDVKDREHMYDKLNLLMLHEDTAPGYCRLQMPWRDHEDMPSGFIVDDEERVIVKNTHFYSYLTSAKLDKNGPAQTGQGGPGMMDFDRVLALPCKHWSKQAGEFTRRRRRQSWPSQRLIEEATRHGVFLVPVGYKLSTTEYLEWRISSSLAERYLMFSLNIVHIKCYVVLKMLKKSFIDTRIQKCISSYHCKTALLYCTENTEPAFWREDNLLSCVMKCLEMLRNWVADLFCPQFIIKDENLFAGKVTAENRELLLSILNEIIKSNGRVLLCVDIDDLGETLQTHLNTEPSCEALMDSFASVVSSGEFEVDMQVSMNYNTLALTVDRDNTGDHLSVVRAVYRDICKLQEMIDDTTKHGRQAINSYIRFLSCWLGSLLASYSLAHNKKVPREAIQLVCTAAKYDSSSMLKLASIFYCNGEFSNLKAESLSRSVEDIFRRNNAQLCCNCYDHEHNTYLEFCQMMHVLKEGKTRARLFAHCVRFSRHEIHCAPPALRHELYKAVGNDMEHRDPEEDKWMDLAVVDCLSYLYYLQYLTYARLEKHDLQMRDLRDLERCVREGEDLPHRETVWNLLGQCWENEQKPDAALTCYRASLEIRPRNNAANWHVAILLYKMFKNRPSLEIGLGNNAVNWHVAIVWYNMIKTRGLLPYDPEDRKIAIRSQMRVQLKI